MTRVLHVIDHLGLGGAQSALLDLVRHLDPSRFSCEVATLHGRGPFADALAREGFRVHSLSKHRWPPGYLARLPRSLAGWPIIHFHLQAANWLAKSFAALETDAIRIAHDHASGDLRFRGFSSLLPDALGHLGSHRVLAVSPSVREFLIRWEAVPADRIRLVPNGVDTEKFRPPDPSVRQRARARLGVAPEDFVIGAIGRLAPEKNFAIIPRIAARLPGVRFLLAGEGPCEAEIRSVLEAERVGHAVQLVGRVDHREEFFSALDALLLPSLYEGLPMVLLEAMATGLPCVASALPDVAAALEDSCKDLLCPPTDTEAFVAAIERLLHDPAAATQQGVRARARCQRDFSATACAARVAQVYDEELALRDGREFAKLPPI